MATKKKAVLKLNDVLLNDVKTIRENAEAQLEKLKEEIAQAEQNIQNSAMGQISQIVSTFLKVKEVDPTAYKFDIETGAFTEREMEVAK